MLTVGLNMSTQRNAIKPLNISPNKITQSIMVMFCYRVWPVFTLIETNRKACSERPWVAAWILQTCFLSLSINKLFYCLFFIQMNTYKPIKFYLALKLNVTLYIWICFNGALLIVNLPVSPLNVIHLIKGIGWAEVINVSDMYSGREDPQYCVLCKTKVLMVYNL